MCIRMIESFNKSSVCQTSKQISPTCAHLTKALQDGEPSCKACWGREGRLDGFHRFEGCLPVSYDLGGPSEYIRFISKSNIQCLLFGKSSTFRVFTKLIKPVAARLHHQHIQNDVSRQYTVDGMQFEEKLTRYLQQVKSTMELLGFVINWEKLKVLPILPIQCLYVVFLLDSREMEIKLRKYFRWWQHACRMIQEKWSLSFYELWKDDSNLTSHLRSSTVVSGALVFTLQKSQSFKGLVIVN